MDAGQSKVRGRKLSAFTVLVLLCLPLAGIGVALAASDPQGETDVSLREKLSAPPVARPGIEIKGLRTSNSETFRLPSGKFLKRTYPAPIHFRTTNGKFAPIELELHSKSDGAVHNGNNAFDLALPTTLGAEPIRLSDDGYWITSRILGFSSESSTVDGTEARYKLQHSELEVNFSSVPGGVKEDIKLNSPTQPTSYRFELRASEGLRPVPDDSGAIEFRDAENASIFTIPAPTMYDSAAPRPTVSKDLRYSLSEADDGSWILTLIASSEWLTSPDRVYPVTIDPSILLPSEYLDCTYGAQTGQAGWRLCQEFGVGQAIHNPHYFPDIDPFNDSRARAALKFPISNMPIDAYVDSASLGLYASVEPQNTSGIEVLGFSKPWNQSLNWKMAISPGSAWTQEGGDLFAQKSQVKVADRGPQPGWWLFNGPSIAEAVQKWMPRKVKNIIQLPHPLGFAVRLIDEASRDCGQTSCLQRSFQFHSGATVDNVGEVLDPSKRPYLEYTYYPPAPSTSQVSFPLDGTRTARRLRLQASWQVPGVTGLKFQYRIGAAGSFTTIPTNAVTDAEGAPVAWPLVFSGEKSSKPVYFDTFAVKPGLKSAGEDVQIRALFEGPGVAGFSVPVKASVNPSIGGTLDGTSSVGPGTLNLLTGNFTVNRTDVSIPAFTQGLEFTRTHSSRGAATWGGDTGILGRGWEPAAPMESAGGAQWRSLREVKATEEEQEAGFGDYAILTDLEGYEYTFEKSGANTFTSPPEAAGWVLSRVSGDEIAFADPKGNRTVFTRTTGTDDYVPTVVSQAGGSTNKTQLVYQLYTDNGANKRRLSMIIAPSAASVGECNESNSATKPGCRSIKFTYKPATNWGAPTTYKDRLSSITYTGPQSATANGSWEVSRYSYDSRGRLIAQWDPRVSPAIKEEYGYVSEDMSVSSAGRVKSITPPGQVPWTLEYGPLSGESAHAGRLRRLKRPSLLASPAVAQTTIAYEVPITGAGAPHDLSSAAIGEWAQRDAPQDATAIFPPDKVPSEPPASYDRAAIFYLDVEGQIVNTASPLGAGLSASITTTENDEHGNVVRELTAQNRLRALVPGVECIVGGEPGLSGSACRAKELDTHRTFTNDGTELQEEWGPLHKVRLSSGSLVDARSHRTIQYNQSAPSPPAGTTPFHLPTREAIAASVPSQGVDADERVVETRYDWPLRKPTRTIIDPNGLALTTRVAYDKDSGLVTERSLPAGSEGGDARTTKFRYHMATGSTDPNCNEKPGWAGLLCKRYPGKQPNTPGLPALPVTAYLGYSPYGGPTVVSIKPADQGPPEQLTVIGYDSAGRQTTWRSSGGGVGLPATRTLYHEANGLPYRQEFYCHAPPCSPVITDTQALTTTYDGLGRVISYEDADGNTSSTSYDVAGRSLVTSDGKGIQTRTYDPTSGQLVELEDSGAGTFTAAYDADGNIVERGLPNGLVAGTEYDETGAATGLSYEKINCSVNCAWLDFQIEESIHGQWLTHTSNLSSQKFGYDAAGRLINVTDTDPAGQCDTRHYKYDANSNRTRLTSWAPGAGGVCNTASGGNIVDYSYDAGDRLLGQGVSYDNFGRITSLPAAYAGGGALSTTYYTNDLVRSQTQSGLTNTYEMDGGMRQRQRSQSGIKSGTEIYHYSDGSDSPAWIQRGSEWSRNVIGIDGGLVAIQSSDGTTTLQLANLHGDIVATASLDPQTPALLARFESDEYGNPKAPASTRYGWLGAKRRSTELPSGVVQMGVRSYVPAIGRFTSLDPVLDGSANSYEYAMADPINLYDLDGMKVPSGCGGKLKVTSRKGKIRTSFRYKCPTGAHIAGHSINKISFYLEKRRSKSGVIGVIEEAVGGKFENVWNASADEFRNPSDPKWRDFGANQSFDCVPGEEYQFKVVLNVTYHSPTGMGQGTTMETITEMGKAVCRQ